MGITRHDVAVDRPRPRPGPVWRTRIVGLLVAAGVTVSLVGGCSDEPGPPADPVARLATAKQRADAAGSVHLVLTSRDVPVDAAGVLGAEGSGTNRPPAFAGTFKVRFRGIEGDTQVVATGGEVWLKLPFAPTLVKADIAAFGAPDPASLMAPEGGITSLLTSTTGAAQGPDVRDGTEVLSTVTGKVPGSAVRSMLRTGDDRQEFDATYGLTSDGDLRKATVTGPFFPGGRSTYEATLDRYGEPVDIRRP